MRNGMQRETGLNPLIPYHSMEDNVATKNWIAGAIKKPGALRASLNVKKGESIPASKLNAAAKKPGKTGQRARLAKTLKGMK
jgi:hypothetical protein